MKVLRNLRHVAFGALIGLVFALLVPLAALGPIYDKLFPVVEMQATLVRFDHDAATIHITGRKLRECRYVRMQAFTQVGEGLLKDITIKRVDLPEVGGTKPLGDYDLGLWQVRPLEAHDDEMLVYVQHECGGRTVVTKVTELRW